LQIEANRRSACLTTGLRTDRDRQISSVNALAGWPDRAAVTVFDETYENFCRFHRQLMRVLRPKGAMEAQFFERAILCARRLRRVYRIETGMFSRAPKVLGTRRRHDGCRY
jgi:hypothetical protein